MSTNDKMRLVQAAYNQHWLQARHVENERIVFTNIFAAIFAGVLAIVKEKLFEISSAPLIVFLMVFSLIGMLFCLKIAYIFKVHTKKAIKILDDYELSDLNPVFSKGWVQKHVKISKIFPIFFFLCFCFLFSILSYIFTKEFFLSIGPSVIFFIIVGYLLYQNDVEKDEEKKKLKSNKQK